MRRGEESIEISHPSYLEGVGFRTPQCKYENLHIFSSLNLWMQISWIQMTDFRFIEKKNPVHERFFFFSLEEHWISR